MLNGALSMVTFEAARQVDIALSSWRVVGDRIDSLNHALLLDTIHNTSWKALCR